MLFNDPDGDILPAIIWGAAIAFSAYQGYKIGKAQGASGWGLAGYAFAGGIIGVVSGGVGSAVSSSVLGATSASLGIIGSNVAAGIAGGAVGGAISGRFMSSLSSESFGEGALNGAILGGAVGGAAGFATGALSKIRLGKAGPINNFADDLGKTDFEFSNAGDDLEDIWWKKFDLPDDQGFGRYTESNYRKSLVKSTGGVTPGVDVHAHHVFPKEYEIYFAEKGINIHDPRNTAWC